ncbi:MAG: DUF1800 domain-containing protein [Vicinamibacteria bacterium]|nr:DUF1800 domain-containing protein [Vicinamibacteria bacterium]
MLAALALAVHALSAASSSVPGSPDDATIVHVLNRLGFGPRPGDVERVRRMGLASWMDQQLRPERIADGAVDARVAGLATLRMTSQQIAQEYLKPLLEQRQQRGRDAASGEPDMDSRRKRPAEIGPVLQRRQELLQELVAQKVLRAVYSERQLQEVLTDFWFNHFNVFANKGFTRIYLTAYERDAIRPHVLGRFRDLLDATAKSPAMLLYLDNARSADPKFAEKAKSDLDRLQRAGRRRGGARQQGRETTPEMMEQVRQNIPTGINENYARELLELHTLGVDGGYTQQDIVNVARALTGWTIGRPRSAEAGQFWFNPRMHDTGDKVVLGQKITGGGIEDGERVLDLLARHPSTARFIATKLARRFVADEPPAALVDRAAATFRQTDGDLREVVRAIVTAPEFFASDTRRAKVKTPFEFVVSALRATEADVQNTLWLARTLQQLGMPLYLCQPPTGYKDTADAWVNSGALISRMNFAVELANGKASARAVAMALGSPEFQRR